jgi:regulator of sigma E protease
MFTILFEIAIFILILSFLVIIHELGHFFAARWAKIKVDEFGLGYPPRAISLFTWAGTVFSLNWIPFGGFVRMDGEDGPESDVELEEDAKKSAKSAKKTANVSSKSKSDSEEGPFYTKTAFQRMVVILAGVIVNFAFGIFAFSVVYSIKGIPELIDSARISAVMPGSPAEVAGLPTDVEIISIITSSEEQYTVQSNADVISAVADQGGNVVTIVTTGTCDDQYGCAESAQMFDVYVRTQDEIPNPENEGALGIRFQEFVMTKYPWYQMPFRGTVVGIEQTYMLIVVTLSELQKMFVEVSSGGPLPADIAGPVGIVHQANEYQIFRQGPLMILNFAGVISASLAIMNLLPIPALDGGRAVFIMIEPLVGKKRVRKYEGYANYGGFMFLIFLIVVITARDIWRIFS